MPEGVCLIPFLLPTQGKGTGDGGDRVDTRSFPPSPDLSRVKLEDAFDFHLLPRQTGEVPRPTGRRGSETAHPLIPEHRHMKRPPRRLPRGIVRVHLHLVRILRQPDGDQAGRHRLVQAAADGAGEIGLRLALQRHLPGDDIAVLALQLAALDHVAPGDRAVGVDDARQSLFEFGHGVLAACFSWKS